MTTKMLRLNNEKFAALCDNILNLKKIVVAFSGGVDSTFLIKLATDLLGDDAMAVTVISPYIAQWEIEEAKELTQSLNIRHHFIEVGIPKEIEKNPVDRCYLCKGIIFSTIKEYAKLNGFDYVTDGSNADDSKDYRPGMRALKELEIRSPLLESNVTKDEIREWSKLLGLKTWDKPPYACLLTRLPYGTIVNIEDLKMIERAEAAIMAEGIRAIRVRKHEGIARIEIDQSEIAKIFDLKIMDNIAKALKKIGFEYVTLDLEGYTMGSFNKSALKEIKQHASK